MADKNLDLKEILARDPVQEAEAALGVKLNTPESMANRDIGLAFLRHAAAVNRQKESALRLMDDTGYSNTLKDYQRIIGELGFTQVLAIDFKTDRNIPERFFVYWRKEGGILLAFDTFGGDHVNGGNFYYNWKPNPSNVNPVYDHSILSSGHWAYESKQAEDELEAIRPKWDDADDNSSRARSAEWGAKFMARAVWVGSHDCRQAIRHNIGGLESAGTFVTPWVERPRPWLIHHGDNEKNESKFDYNTIINQRLAALPDEVRAAICVN